MQTRKQADSQTGRQTDTQAGRQHYVIVPNVTIPSVTFQNVAIPNIRNNPERLRGRGKAKLDEGEGIKLGEGERD
jgi:hypothetical protein